MRAKLLLTILYVAVTQALLAQEELEQIAESFATGQIVVDGQSYGYRLLEPLPLQRDRARPLLVYLHGAGERGDDNIRQLYWLPRMMAQPKRREQLPCFLLAVQCPREEQWVDVPWGEVEPRPFTRKASRAMRAVQAATDEVLTHPGVDPARVYLVGMSMGGYGTWDLLAREPERFAAAVPVCGGGDPITTRRMIGLPISIWHGAADSVVPVQRSQLMVAELQQLAVPVNYHELAGVGHNVWQQAFANGQAIDWLFAQDQRQQHRGAFREAAIIPWPDSVVPLDGVFRLQPGNRCVAPDELRGLASYFLDALPVPAVRRPGLVHAVEPVAGDLELRLEPAMQAVYRLEIRDIVRLVAPDLRGMRAGLAALYQALRTLPGGGAPAGIYRQDRRLPSGYLEVPRADDSWRRVALAALLRECWLGSVETICFEGGAQIQMSTTDYQKLLAEAEQLGVDVAGEFGIPRVGRVATATFGDRIAQLLVGVTPADQMIVRLAPAQPEAMLVQARQLLGATVEGAQRGARPVHLGGFLARLSARWR